MRQTVQLSAPATTPGRCRVCDAMLDGPVEELADKNDMFGEPLRRARCEACGVVFQPEVPLPERLVEWYDYMAHQPPVTPFLERRLARTLRALQPFRKTGRMLEVGPGGGELVDAARARGWEVYATEIAASCCRRLEPVLGARLYEGELPSARFEEGSFDVVVMMEVLEHLVDPVAYLRAAWALLRRGGCVFLTTPHFRGASGRVWGLRWRIVNEEHLNYFDRSSMKKILETTGFADARLLTTGLDLTMLRQQLRGDGSRAPGSTASAAGQSKRPSDSKAALKDAAVELVNGLLRLVALGDTLKVFAVKPPAD